MIFILNTAHLFMKLLKNTNNYESTAVMKWVKSSQSTLKGFNYK